MNTISLSLSLSLSLILPSDNASRKREKKSCSSIHLACTYYAPASKTHFPPCVHRCGKEEEKATATDVRAGSRVREHISFFSNPFFLITTAGRKTEASQRKRERESCSLCYPDVCREDVRCVILRMGTVEEDIRADRASEVGQDRERASSSLTIREEDAEKV